MGAPRYWRARMLKPGLSGEGCDGVSRGVRPCAWKTVQRPRWKSCSRIRPGCGGARRLVDDDEQARDVVQETWMRALRHRLGSKAVPAAVAATSSRNIAAQFRRTDRRRDARGAKRPSEALPPVDRVRARGGPAHGRGSGARAAEPYRGRSCCATSTNSPAAIAAPGRAGFDRAQSFAARPRAVARAPGVTALSAGSWLAALEPLIPSALRSAHFPWGP